MRVEKREGTETLSEGRAAASVLAQALTDNRPKRRYMVGSGARKMSVLSHFPAGTRDRMLAKAIYGRST